MAIRGSNNYQVLILVDGVRVADPSRIDNDFDLNFLSLDQIDSIEILKGGASTLYGSAAAAVINITTKKIEGKSQLNLGLYIRELKSLKIPSMMPSPICRTISTMLPLLKNCNTK